jgi:hypothetical protein
MQANYLVGLAVAGSLSVVGALAFYQLHRAPTPAVVAAQRLATSAPLRTDSTAAALPADSAAAQAVHFVGGVQQVLVAHRYVARLGATQPRLCSCGSGPIR